MGAEKGGGAGVEIEEEVGTTEEAGGEVEVEAGEGLEAVARREAEAGRSAWRLGQNCSGRLKMLPWETMSFTSGISVAGAGNQS